MKKLSLILAGSLLLVFAASVVWAGDVWVRGYTRRDGTYVRPHYRTRPDGNPWNNYSTRGNVNPYTGRPGYRSPYSQSPSYGLGTPRAPLGGYQQPLGNSYLYRRRY